MPGPSPTNKKISSDRLNIVAISRAYSRQAGGMERFSFELIHALKRRNDLKVKAIVRHLPRQASRSYVRLSAVLFAILVSPRAILAARKAKIVHLGDPVLSLVGWLIKTILKKPIAVTVHGLDVTYPNALYQKYLNVFFRSFDLYLPISKHASEKLSRLNVNGLCAVISPGLNDRLYDPGIKRRQLEKIIKKPIKNKQIILTTGRLVKRKGHAWFIKEVLPLLPSTTLYVIAGQGPEENAIRSAASQASVSSRVILLGRVKDTTLKILLNTTDAFIQPNIPVANDAEGFGLVLIEAASCELPVFASLIDGIPDAIHQGRNGTLLPPMDPTAWSNALKNFLSRPTRNPNARQYTLDTFSWSKQANAYADHFKTVIK